MLPAFLSLAAHAQIGDDPTTPLTTSAAAWAAVRATGYDVTPKVPDDNTGAAVHDGLKAFVSLARTTGDPAKGVPDTYTYLSVWMEWATLKEIDPDEAERWHTKAQPGPKVRFTPHLGRTATVWGFVPLANAKGTAGVRADLDALWADAAALAARYAPNTATVPFSEPKDLRFDPALRLKRADQVSLQRVTDAWGWHSDEPANAAVAGWSFSILVDGKLLWLHGEMDGAEFSLRRFRVERLAAKGTTEPGAALDIANLYKLGPGTYYGGVFHPREAYESFDLTKPLSLADLRRRIEAFARKG